MTAHNHPPCCCCQHDPRDVAAGDLGDRALYPLIACPLCPEHGELAQLAEPQPGECPICHSEIGKQHTDYCRFTGVVSMSARLPQSIAAHFVTQTTQPATTTSQPDTHSRSLHVDPNPHPRTDCDPDLCGLEPTRRGTPGYDGPEGTEWPRSPIQWHQTGPDDAHERWQCSRDTCGIAPDRAGNYKHTPPQTPTPHPIVTTRAHQECPRCLDEIPPFTVHTCH